MHWQMTHAFQQPTSHDSEPIMHPWVSHCPQQKMLARNVAWHERLQAINNDVCSPDNDELCVLRSLLDVVGNNGHVLEVEGSINLVHDIQRSGLVVM